MPSKVVSLAHPLGGVNRKRQVQFQPPYTTPSALNVRPTDQIKLRRRIGSRPGTIKAFTTQLGSGNPINLLNTISTVTRDGFTFWADYFDQASLAPYWIATGGNSPAILPDNIASITYGNTAGVVRTTAPAGFQTSSAYVAEVFIVPYEGEFHGNYEIYVGCSGSAPYTNGFVFRLSMPDGSGDYAGSAYRYSGGVIQESYLFTNGSTGAANPGWFSVICNGVNMQVTWQGQTILNQNFGFGATATNFGFGGEATQAGGILLFDTFRLQYSTTNGNVSYRKLAVAASNGTLYKSAWDNTFSAVSSSLTLNTGRNLQSAERLQKLYIADNGVQKASGTNGVVSSGSFDSASYTDWTTVGIDTDDDVIEITSVVGGSGGFQPGVYAINTVVAGNFGLTGATGSCTSCTFRIMRGPKVYDPSAATLTALLQGSYASALFKGSVPIGCTMVVQYRDRLVWAGDPNAPHAFFASRQGDPTDYDYGARSSDAGRAVAGTNTAAGGLSEPITALIPFGDDRLLIATASSIYMLSGDWATGGDIQLLSGVIGCVGRFAHCRIPSGEIVLMTRDGLYMIPPGGGTPVAISREKLPDELARLDSQIYDISLAYDVEARGVHIFISQNESTSTFGTSQYHWWLDWEDKGFHPFNLPSAQQPRMALYQSGSCAEDSCVWLGGRDGYVRRFHRYAEFDDGTSFSSHCYIGPIVMGDAYTNGVWAELFATVAQESGSIAWALYSGENYEEAINATTAFASGTWTDEVLNYKHHPRMRGNAGILKISNGGNRRWAIETMTARIDKAGAQRK